MNDVKTPHSPWKSTFLMVFMETWGFSWAMLVLGRVPLMNPQNTPPSKPKDVKFLFSGCGANLRALEGGTEGASREQLFEFLLAWKKRCFLMFFGVGCFSFPKWCFQCFPFTGCFFFPEYPCSTRELGGGFKYFLFSSLVGGMIQFD